MVGCLFKNSRSFQYKKSFFFSFFTAFLLLLLLAGDRKARIIDDKGLFIS